MRIKLLRALALLVSLLWIVPAQAQIAHLEIGAANYSADSGNSPERFLILEDTAMILIKSHGPSGVITLNDIDRSGLEMAQQHLQSWLGKRGYSDIRVEILHGDYLKVDLPTLKTAHMKNPDYRQLPMGLDKDIRSETNRRILDGIDRIANHSRTGLVVTTDYDSYMKKEHWKMERSRMIKSGNTGSAYYAANYEKGDGYMEAPREYLIMPRSILCGKIMLGL